MFQAARTQYFEVFTNRAIYDQGWMACPAHLPWRPDLAPGNWDDDTWEPYNLADGLQRGRRPRRS